jgi:hypothetical protein
MRVPREIDELMWAVAEDGRESTIDQFNSRYPEFEGELEKRRHMVGSLKGSRPHAELPRFVPRQQVRSFGPSRLVVVGVAALVLASVTLATYATMQIVNGKRSAPAPVDGPEIVFNPPQFDNDPIPVEPDKSTAPMQPDEVQPLQETSQVNDIYMGRITIQSSDVSLEQAIKDMVAQAGLYVTIAPGFEDKRIRVSFVEQPLFDVLQELGQHFGFTAFKQGSAEILIVPALDQNPRNTIAGPGSTSPVETTSGGGNGPGKVNTKPPDAPDGEGNPPLSWPTDR